MLTAWGTRKRKATDRQNLYIFAVIQVSPETNGRNAAEPQHPGKVRLCQDTLPGGQTQSRKVIVFTQTGKRLGIHRDPESLTEFAYGDPLFLLEFAKQYEQLSVAFQKVRQLGDSPWRVLRRWR